MKTRIIATVGKGGVGKTSLSAAFLRLLTERYPDKKILAIDADPAVGLSTALGVEPEQTLDDIRKSIVDNVESGHPREAIEMLNEAKFRIVDAMRDTNSFSFLAIGRPESAGCYCKVNAYLKEVITLLASDFDYVIIDGEAGIEQINRRVMEKVTDLVLVSDASKKGLSVIDTIRKVADRLVMYENRCVVINRMTVSALPAAVPFAKEEIAAIIPADNRQTENDMNGESVFALPPDSPILQGAETVLKKLGIVV